MRGIHRMALIAACLAIGTACRTGGPTLASAIQRADFENRAAGDSDIVSVRVENNDFPDLDVYLLTESDMRVRIGMAPGHNVTTLTVPKTYVPAPAQLRFITRPIGGGQTNVTDPMMVAPGEEVVLTVISSS